MAVVDGGLFVRMETAISELDGVEQTYRVKVGEKKRAEEELRSAQGRLEAVERDLRTAEANELRSKRNFVGKVLAPERHNRSVGKWRETLEDRQMLRESLGRDVGEKRGEFERAESELAGARSDIEKLGDLRRQRSSFLEETFGGASGDAEEEYWEAETQRLREEKVACTAESKKHFDVLQEVKASASKMKESERFIQAALSDNAYDLLTRGGGVGGYDLLLQKKPGNVFGGSVINDYAGISTNNNMAAAKKTFKEAQAKMSAAHRINAELPDAAELQLDYSDLLSIRNLLFDNVKTDTKVREKISEAKKEVLRAKFIVEAALHDQTEAKKRADSELRRTIADLQNAEEMLESARVRLVHARSNDL